MGEVTNDLAQGDGAIPSKPLLYSVPRLGADRGDSDEQFAKLLAFNTSDVSYALSVHRPGPSPTGSVGPPASRLPSGGMMLGPSIEEASD